MRKNFLTKEYSSLPIAGTMNQKEQRAFFSSKILEIEDTMYIGDTNINWTESSDKTQGIRLEDVNRTFNTSTVKKINHSISLSAQQSDQEKREFTKWEFNFNVREMITEYLFSQLKTNRVFANIDNSATLNNDIDDAINQYITNNVYPRINFFNIVMYVRYYRLGEPQGFLDSNNNPVIALQYDNQFRENLITLPSLAGESTSDYQKRSQEYKDSIKIKNFQISTDSNQNIATVIYKQTQSSLSYKFDYYYDVIWVKA